MPENLNITKQENYLFFSDLHLKEPELEECSLILDEIVTLCKEHQITKIFDLGDTFDGLRPTSKELDLFSNFIKKINMPIIILAADSHESTTPENSIVNHFGILNDNAIVVKEYQDGNHLFCGHFIVKESKKNFGATISKSELKYKYVFLGHSHSFEIIKPNICQLGSVRFVDFAESGDNQKVVAIIENYGEKEEKVQFIPLKSPYPMTDIELTSNKGTKIEETSPKETLQEAISAQNGEIAPNTNNPESSISQAQTSSNPRENEEVCQLIQKLDQTDPKTKIRIIYKNYELWRAFLPFQQKYKDKFVKFVDKKEFIISATNQKDIKKENTNLLELLNSWLEKNNIPEAIKKVLNEEVK